MPYIYEEAERLEKLPAVGTKQGVALIEQYTKAPQTPLWKEGGPVKGRLTLKTFRGWQVPESQHGE
jgi:hypothetical protein